MGLVPSVKAILPSLHIHSDDTATIAMADLKKHLPSLEIASDGREVPDTLTIRISLADLRKMLRIALSSVAVDEKWYVAQVQGLREAIRNGKFQSAADHYHIHGFLECRPPEKPIVDEEYYLKTHSDVAEALKTGKVKSAYEHYLQSGYSEGRIAFPPAKERKK